MNRYDPNQPIEPFYVPAKVLRSRVEGVSNGDGGGPAPGRPPSIRWEDPNSWATKAVGAAVFVAAYVSIDRRPVLLPIAIFLMAITLLFRLDGRRRAIAAAPLLLGAIRLASQISASLQPTAGRSLLRQGLGVMPAWVPLFLGACLLFGPSFRTVTEIVTVTWSSVLLLSGLLPCEGYLLVFVMVEYLLFVSIAISLAVDLTSKPLKPAAAVGR